MPSPTSFLLSCHCPQSNQGCWVLASFDPMIYWVVSKSPLSFGEMKTEMQASLAIYCSECNNSNIMISLQCIFHWSSVWKWISSFKKKYFQVNFQVNVYFQVERMELRRERVASSSLEMPHHHKWEEILLLYNILAKLRHKVYAIAW